MTRLEFNETIKALMPGIKIDDESYGIDFYDFRVIYDKFNIKIKGKIPYAVAKAIEEKYLCEKLGIRTGTIGLSTCPDAFFKDDIYHYEVNKKVPKESIDSRARRLDAERFKLSKRPNAKKYLDIYRIDTKEGLIAVLKELEYYCNRRKKNNIAPEDSIPSTITNANVHIIESINPCITGQHWMMQSINGPEYYQGWNRTNSTLALQELRRALDEYDRSVNPFMENDLPIEKITNDLSNLDVSLEVFSYDDEYRNNPKYYSICLTDEETRDHVTFGINPAGFSYSSIFHLGEQHFMMVRHYYSYDAKEENQGEILSIEYFGDKAPMKKKIRFNITKGTIGEPKESKKVATPLQVATIYLDLVNATNLAANMTVNNLSRNRSQNQTVN